MFLLLIFQHLLILSSRNFHKCSSCRIAVHSHENVRNPCLIFWLWWQGVTSVYESPGSVRDLRIERLNDEQNFLGIFIDLSATNCTVGSCPCDLFSSFWVSYLKLRGCFCFYQHFLMKISSLDVHKSIIRRISIHSEFCSAILLLGYLIKHLFMKVLTLLVTSIDIVHVQHLWGSINLIFEMDSRVSLCNLRRKWYAQNREMALNHRNRYPNLWILWWTMGEPVSKMHRICCFKNGALNRVQCGSHNIEPW